MYVLNVLIGLALFISCNAAFVDTIPKRCSIKDDKCMNELIKNILTNIAKTGIPEFDIPVVDPFTVKDFSMTVLDSVKLNIVEGVVKGLKNCQLKKFHADLEKKTGSFEIICNLTVKGHITFKGSSPVIQSLLGRDSIEGEGTGKIKVEKLRVALNFPFYPVKQDDGEIYIHWPSKEIKYKYEIERVNFAGEKIYLGKDEITPFVVAYVNENWRTLLDRFGDNFINAAKDNYLKFGETVFNKIPASKFLTDDLTPYL